MPRRAVPPPPGGRRRRAGAAKRKAPNVPNRARMEGSSRGRQSKGGGIDLPKFASEVSRNYARGVAQVGREIDKHVPSRQASSGIGGAVRTGPASKEYLRRALGGK